MISFHGKQCPTSYLGDGVCAIYNGLGIWLYANDLWHPTDRVYLEPEVLRSLNRFSLGVLKLKETPGR